MRIFVDNCLPIAIAKAVRELSSYPGVEVVHLSEKFDASEKDAVWIRKLQSEGDWVIVSGDSRISRSKVEKAEWLESGLTAFFFDDLTRRGFWIQAVEVVRWWKEILDAAAGAPAGSGFLLKFKAKEMREIYRAA